MLSLALLAFAAAAPDTRISVVAEALPPCLSISRLESRLPPADAELKLRGDGGDRLIVELRRGTDAFSRTLVVPANGCDELQRTIALLVSAWLSPRPSLRPPVAGTPRSADAAVTAPVLAPPPPAPPAVAPPTVGPSAVGPSAVAPPTAVSTRATPSPRIVETPAVPTAVQAAAAELVAAPVKPSITVAALAPVRATATDAVTAPPPASTAPAAAESGSSPAAPPPSLVAAVPVPSELPARRYVLWLALRGQTSFDGRWVGAGAVAVDAGLRAGLGGAVDLGIETARGQASMGGHVSSWMGWLGAQARYTFELGPVLLWVGAGGRVYRLSATASGFTTNGSAELYLPAAAAQVEVRWPLVAGLALLANASGFWRVGETQLTIDGVGVVDRLGPGGFSLGLGAAWQFL